MKISIYGIRFHVINNLILRKNYRQYYVYAKIKKAEFIFCVNTNKKF